MGVLEFRPYKHLEDKELLEEVFEEMEKLHKLSNSSDEKSYWKVARILNDMIIETKKRKLKVDNETLIRKILI